MSIIPFKSKKAKQDEPKASEAKERGTMASGGSVLRGVLVRPHASEKSYGLHAKNQYVFIVERSANKTLVKEEVQHRYHVRVVDVDILVNKGKVKTYRGRAGTASPYKKAFVTLKQGDKIEIV